MIDVIAKSFKPRVQHLPSGLLMFLDLEESNQLKTAVDGATEPNTIGLIQRVVEDGDIVLDIGAHVGHLALEAARAAGSAGRVFAFDPQPYSADRVAANAALNGLHNVISVCAAAGAREEVIRIPLQSFRDRSRLAIAEPPVDGDAVMVEVPMRRLDAFIDVNRIETIGLLKIDVEGYEWEVLQGLGSRIDRVKNIVFELLNDTAEEKSCAVFNYLQEEGYEFFDVLGEALDIKKLIPENNVWAKRRAP